MEEETTARRRMPGLPRFVDLMLAVLGLVATLPLLALCALAIAATDGLPVLFHQQRVGLGGRVFRLHKLRSMRLAESELEITVEGDTRITTVGRIIRRFKLDELPQLWNVVVGNMALVGPRPEVERYVDMNDRRWQRILSVRPGITDPTTLEFRDEERTLATMSGDPAEDYLRYLQPLKLEKSIAYLERRSWWTDIGVLCKTVTAFLLPIRHRPPSRSA